MTKQPVEFDQRYHIVKEFCGQPEARYVVRFCGKWVGQSANRSDAVQMASEHYQELMNDYQQ